MSNLTWNGSSIAHISQVWSHYIGVTDLKKYKNEVASNDTSSTPSFIKIHLLLKHTL